MNLLLFFCIEQPMLIIDEQPLNDHAFISVIDERILITFNEEHSYFKDWRYNCYLLQWWTIPKCILSNVCNRWSICNLWKRHTIKKAWIANKWYWRWNWIMSHFFFNPMNVFEQISTSCLNNKRSTNGLFRILWVLFDLKVGDLFLFTNSSI